MAPTDTSALQMQLIAKLEEADFLLASPNAVDIKGVHRMDMVTKEWLTEVLGAKVPGASLESAESVGGHEGMTSRHKWKLAWNTAGKEAGLPTDIFFKATPTETHLLEMLALLHMAEREVDIYNTIGGDLHDLIPKCYYAKSYPGGRHIIILEDLEVKGIKPHWMADECSIPFARAVAVAQAKIHARFWGSDRFEKDLIFLRPKSRRYGELWQNVFFDANRKTFLASDLGKTMTPEIKELIETWNANSVAVNEYFDAKTPTVVHGDSHLGNVLEYADGSAGMYDWQCCFRGYGYRDLSYFLMSALTIDDVKAHEREIFDLYTDTLEENGVSVDRTEAWDDYCLLSLDRFDSAMSSLSRGGYGHGISAFQRQVATISYCAKEHDVLGLLKRVVKLQGERSG